MSNAFKRDRIDPASNRDALEGAAAQGMLLAALRAYQRFISPLLPFACRFTPSCSQYAIEAIRARGSLIGLCLTVWRLCRCQPFCQGGCDPVPLPPKRADS